MERRRCIPRLRCTIHFDSLFRLYLHQSHPYQGLLLHHWHLAGQNLRTDSVGQKRRIRRFVNTCMLRNHLAFHRHQYPIFLDLNMTVYLLHLQHRSNHVKILDQYIRQDKASNILRLRLIHRCHYLK